MTDVSGFGGKEVHIRREPLTYELGNGNSFIADLVRAYTGDTRAQDRLTRHQREFEVEQRTNPNTAAGTGGEFAPPLWLIPLFGAAATAGRVLADLIDAANNRFVLPDGVSSVHVPKITTGATTGVQPFQGDPAVSTDEVTADTNSPVVTISGNVDASLQLLDQTPPPGYDKIALTDLAKNYNRQLDQQIQAGTGVNGQVLGLTNVASIQSVDGSSATTIQNQWPLYGQVQAKVGNNRLLPTQGWLLAPRRWAWITSSVDQSQRPIGSPAQNVEVSSVLMGGTPAVGKILGKPVWESGAIPAGTSADYALAVRPDDYYLWESAPKLAVVNAPLSGTLQVRIQLRRYVAFAGNRYPSGIGVLTGMTQPSNF